MRTEHASAHFTATPRMKVVVTPPAPGIRREIDVAVPMRDGAVLSGNVYRPEGDEPVPAIVAMTIYRKEEHKKHYDVFLPVANTHLGIMRFSDEATFEGPDPAFWVPHDYAVVHVDARGFGKSPGAGRPFSEPAFEDFYDIIEWVGAQPWCNGKVGLSGVSYLGTSQYFAAALQPPSLKAINPWDARTDRFRSDYLGGIPNTFMSRWIFENFTIPSLNDPSGAPEMLRFTDIAGAPRLITDPYHAERVRLRESVARIAVPTLIGGSVSDQAKHSRDAFENFMAIGSPDKWLYIHRDPEWAAYYDESGLAIQRRFFDHFLKGADNGWDAVPRVFGKVYESLDRYHLRSAETWPIPGTDYRRLLLMPGGDLADTAGDGTTAYASDGSARASFALTFAEDTLVLGHTRLHLRLSIDAGEDADLFVGLKKLDADGDEVFFLGESGNNPNDIVSRGWLRASHRALAPDSADWRPILAHSALQPLIPGEPVDLDVEIHPTNTLFRAGETLVLVVQGASIGPSDVAIGFEEVVNRGRHVIHHGGASWLQIPVVPATPQAGGSIDAA